MFDEYFSDWDYVLSFFPSGWEDKLRELGALKFGRKFSGKDGSRKLLRALFIHLCSGCSLRETAVWCKQGDIVDISDVALLKRLRKSGSWFNWCISELLPMLRPSINNARFTDMNFRVVDGSIIKEPGVTGSQWRLHYSVGLRNLCCDEIEITSSKKGENFKNFKVSSGDVLLGDRGYAQRSGVAHVHKHGGNVLLRFSPWNFPLVNLQGNAFQLLRNLRKLKTGEVGDWDVRVKFEGEYINGRVCAVKKSPGAVKAAQKKVLRKAQKDGVKNIKKNTLEYAGYVLIFTTLSRKKIKASEILEIYRYRWQIEIVFKRLKSILELGHLHKYDEASSKAWLSGKILVSLIVELMLRAGETFSPWGYPLREN